MYACIYFIEDATLSVVNTKDKNLSVEEGCALEPKAKVTMKWGRTTYNGTVIKLHDNEEDLLNFATKSDGKLRKKYKEKPSEVPEELFTYAINLNQSQELHVNAKRSRTETERLKESKEQDIEISPKKKKQKIIGNKKNDKQQAHETNDKTADDRKSSKKNDKKGPLQEKNQKKKCEEAATKTTSLIMCDLMSQLGPPASTADKDENQRKKHEPEVNREHLFIETTTPNSSQYITCMTLDNMNTPKHHQEQIKEPENVNYTNEVCKSLPPLPDLSGKRHNYYPNQFSQICPPKSYHVLDNINNRARGPNASTSSSCTSMLDTWDLVTRCNNIDKFDIHVPVQDPSNNHMQNQQDDNAQIKERTKTQSTHQIPVPTCEVIQAIRNFVKPEVQVYLKSVVDYFDKEQQYSKQDAEDNSVEVEDNSVEPTSNMANEWDNTCMTPVQVPLRRSPRKKLYSCNKDQDTIDQKESCSATETTPLQRSPKKLNCETPQTPQTETEDKTEPLLKAFPSVLVKTDVIRAATAAARRAPKPGYTLCYKLLIGVFTEETLANSRGQGITKPKQGETRPPLDKERVEAIKEYTIKWCKKNEKEVPKPSDMNNAITEQVSHCRKKIKKRLSQN